MIRLRHWMRIAKVLASAFVGNAHTHLPHPLACARLNDGNAMYSPLPPSLPPLEHVFLIPHVVAPATRQEGGVDPSNEESPLPEGMHGPSNNFRVCCSTRVRGGGNRAIPRRSTRVFMVQPSSPLFGRVDEQCASRSCRAAPC